MELRQLLSNHLRAKHQLVIGRSPRPPTLKVLSGYQVAEKKVYLVFYCHYHFQGSVNYLLLGIMLPTYVLFHSYMNSAGLRHGCSTKVCDISSVWPPGWKYTHGPGSLSHHPRLTTVYMLCTWSTCTVPTCEDKRGTSRTSTLPFRWREHCQVFTASLDWMSLIPRVGITPAGRAARPGRPRCIRRKKFVLLILT